ncbi:hypothetical protein CERZMDRAFT_88927 [Cercospora zeae-maydis SCOH1-5]|uniref:RRM domain-containing protein n=1 Tax=Cercospora zeae-maydis SCOH1-5 TaxID=717836 RepID=A0A6A6EZM4_9PEZI|nr:hypothetical protein CERZMDRAFT_88927 [Cercospora zeae-maydis SCOH1-5]
MESTMMLSSSSATSSSKNCMVLEFVKRIVGRSTSLASIHPSIHPSASQLHCTASRQLHRTSSLPAPHRPSIASNSSFLHRSPAVAYSTLTARTASSSRICTLHPHYQHIFHAPAHLQIISTASTSSIHPKQLPIPSPPQSLDHSPALLHTITTAIMPSTTTLNRNNKIERLIEMRADRKSFGHLAAMALADTRAQRASIRFVDGGRIVYYNGGSSEPNDQIIPSTKHCDLEADGWCLFHEANHLYTTLRFIDDSFKDLSIGADFALARQDDFARALDSLASLVKASVPSRNQLAITTRLVGCLEDVFQTEVTCRAARPLEAKHKELFRHREVDGMVELEMPKDPWPKRFATKEREDDINHPDAFKNPLLDMPLDSLWRSPASIASAPATFSSSLSDISSPQPASFRASLAKGTHRYTPTEDIVMPSVGDLLVPIDTRFGPAYNQKLLDYHQACFENAQQHLAADAVLFVGNLPTQFTDLQLITAVGETLRSVGSGTCFINVARTYNGSDVLPHALVQFYTPMCVDLALERVKGLTIAGRRLRVERSHAKHSLCVVRADGTGEPDSHEVDALLGHYGDFHPEWRHTGCHVTFHCYGSYLRAKEALRGKVVNNLWVR